MKLWLGEAEFWGVGKYSLSIQNPGPIDIEFNSLSEEQKRMIENSIQAGEISLAPKPVRQSDPTDNLFYCTDLKMFEMLITATAMNGMYKLLRQTLKRLQSAPVTEMTIQKLGIINRELKNKENRALVGMTRAVTYEEEDAKNSTSGTLSN